MSYSFNSFSPQECFFFDKYRNYDFSFLTSENILEGRARNDLFGEEAQRHRTLTNANLNQEMQIISMYRHENESKAPATI